MSKLLERARLSGASEQRAASRLPAGAIRAGSRAIATAASKSRIVLHLMAALSFVTFPIFSQTTDTGTVLGVVTDPSGAAVPAGAVDLRDTSTSAVRSTVTNGSGRYTFVGVKPGVYSLSAAAAGFEQSVATSVTVEVGRSVTINFTLKIGQRTEQVQVTATPGAELQTLDATVGNTIGGNTLLSLPSQLRNTTSLMLLQPLAMPQEAPNQGSNKGGQVAGARSDQNMFQLDGGNITSGASGDSAYWNVNNGAPEGAIPTPVESIEEFKVATNNQSASFTGSAGAQATLVTKRGTNTFHGSLYEYLQNYDMNANAWDRNRIGQANPASRDNRFGGSLGGYFPKLPAAAKTYFYVNYEGRRLSQAYQLSRLVPTDTLKQGILRFRDAAGNVVSYNLATSQQCGPTGNSACDPRALGLNPLVSQIWNKYEPEGNNTSLGDGLNTIGYSAPANLPVTNDFMVARLDHSFGTKWQLMSSYRYFSETQAVTKQFDIGGLLPGDVKGVPTATSVIPRQPRFFVLGLTGLLSPTITNEFHFSILRDNWTWNTAGAPPQVPGTNAALELGGESTANALIPMNADATDIRTRSWDSQYWNWSDNLSMMRGNHLFQMGGNVLRNHVEFERADGQTSILQPVDIITSTSGLNIPTANRPPTCTTALTSGCILSSQVSNWNTLYSQVLGMVDSVAVLRTRNGSLNLNPVGTPVFTDTSYDNYQLYVQDSWRIRPALTINYGLQWGVAMPPLEAQGKFSIATDPANMVIDPNRYLQLREQAALQGQVYNPTISFDPINNSGMKYPFHPTWDSFAPRVAVAWNPKFLGDNKTVIRAGYARLYDRLNGVQTIIDPDQGYGFTVNNQCLGPSMSGQCLGAGGATPSTAFRAGVDGSAVPLPSVSQTASSPLTPGITGFPGANTAFTASSYHLDPNYRPAPNDQFDVTIQRELPGQSILEFGYVGRLSRNLFSSYQLNQPPFFMVYGGQSFAQAFDNVSAAIRGGSAVTPQPFFESALAGSSFCKTTSCTAGVVSQYSGTFSAQQVLNLWNGIQPSFVFGPATAASDQLSSFFYYNSQGIANYNAGFISWRQSLANKLTLNANLTYSHSMDENGQIQTSDNAFANSYNPSYDYGTSQFDRKVVFNLLAVYQAPYIRGHRFMDKVVRGWSIAPIFSWFSGLPLKVADGSGQEFGQTTANAAQAILTQPDTFGNSVHSGITGTSTVATTDNPATGGSGLNLFANPGAVYSAFRPIMLSADTTSGGGGRLRGQSRWNLDASLARKFTFSERSSITFTAQVFNVFNHVWFADPSLSLQSPQTFGVLSSQANIPRALELGLHLDF